MEIKIRKAQPEDVGSAFSMVYSAGPHEFDYLFCVGGKTFQEYFNFAFPAKLGVISYRVFTVAIVGDQVAGLGSFIHGKDRVRHDLGNIWSVIQFFGPINVPKIAQASAHIDSILPHPKANELYIGQLGVKEEYRGQGIGSALLRHHIEAARAKGIHKCVLDVAMTNPEAKKLYERLGFKVVGENPWNHPESPIHVPGQFRMELVL